MVRLSAFAAVLLVMVSLSSNGALAGELNPICLNPGTAFSSSAAISDLCVSPGGLCNTSLNSAMAADVQLEQVFADVDEPMLVFMATSAGTGGGDITVCGKTIQNPCAGKQTGSEGDDIYVCGVKVHNPCGGQALTSQQASAGDITICGQTVRNPCAGKATGAQGDDFAVCGYIVHNPCPDLSCKPDNPCQGEQTGVDGDDIWICGLRVGNPCPDVECVPAVDSGEVPPPPNPGDPTYPKFDQDCGSFAQTESVCAWSRSTAGNAASSLCNSDHSTETHYCVFHGAEGGGSSTTTSGKAEVWIHGTEIPCGWSKATYKGQGLPGCSVSDVSYHWKPRGLVESGPCTVSRSQAFAYGPLGEDYTLAEAEATSGAYCP